MPSRFFSTAALLVPVLALAGAAQADTPTDTPAGVAKKIEAYYKDRSDIRAVFTQVVKKPGRARAITKEGNVFFKRPGMMRWDYQKPEKVFYISDGTTLWTYQPEDALVTKLDVKSSELYHQSRYLFGQGNLTEDFDVAAHAATPEKDGFGLLLKPKKSARDFKQLVLVVDPSTGEIRRTELTDPYDNVSIVTFQKLEYRTLDEKPFRFTPPANATIRDLSKQAPASK